jgi:hypothetical protein
MVMVNHHHPWVAKQIRSLMMMMVVEKSGFRLRGNLAENPGL